MGTLQNQNMPVNDPLVGAAILIVEDEIIFAQALSRRLGHAGYECRVVGNLSDARAALNSYSPQLMLLDLRLPDGSGLDFLQQLREGSNNELPVIVMTAYGEIDDAVAAMKLAAADYLKKPFDLEELILAVGKVLESEKTSTQLRNSRAREAHEREIEELIGDSAQTNRLRDQIKKISQLCSVPDAIAPTVLITGETGTGKDITARQLHRQSARCDRPFVHVDCAALPSELIETELFGHVKGAFTNAHTQRTGLIQMAEDGVVFLDEIGELPFDLQAKLLAVLERRMLRRVGSSKEHAVEAWFIAATNRDVKTIVADGVLRSDLYYRLNVLTLALSPLRERHEDIVAFSRRFGEQTARRYGIGDFVLTSAARDSLEQYAWPGNVRELRHLIERATLLSGDGVVTEETLMLPALSTPAALATRADFLHLTLDDAEHLLIGEALERCDHNVSAAARELGITRMAMRYRMKRHGYI